MTTAPSITQHGLRVPGLRPALAVTGVVGVAGAALGGAVSGEPQAWGAGVGAALVAAFFVFGSVGSGLAAAYAPRLSLVVALVTYVLQVVLLGLVLAAVSDSRATWVDPRWLGGAVLVGTLGWSLALVIDAGVRR